MATYTYLAADLRTNAILAELPLKGVGLRSKLNGAGDFAGAIQLGDPSLDKLGLRNATQTCRTALYVDRDGVLIWGGIIWTSDYLSGDRKLSLAGTEFASYFSRREIRDSKVYAGQDQLFIARDLIAYAQSKPGGNIGVTVGTESCGVLNDASWKPWDRKPVLEAIAEQASQQNGYDWGIDVAYDSNGVPQKYLHLSYPRRGQRFLYSGLMFEYPGNIADYDWPEDGSRMADSVTAQGSGSETNMLMSTVTDTSLIDDGYPLLETTRPYTSISLQASLDRHAQADLAALSVPVSLPTLRTRADMDPVLGSYVCGDDCRLRVTDDRFNTGRDTDGRLLGPGLDTYMRIYAMDVQPGDDAPEAVNITLGPTV